MASKSLSQKLIQDPLTKRFLYVGYIGNIACLLVSFILLFHVLYYHNQISIKNRHVQDGKKKIYRMIAVYLVSIIIFVLLVSCVSSNAFTGISKDQFSILQCTIAHASIPIAFAVPYVLLYTILLVRIKFIFKDSIYGYKPWVFRVYYSGIAVQFCLLTSIHVYYSIKATQWGVYYQDDFYKAACFFHLDPEMAKVKAVRWIISIATHFVINLGLLYLFLKGLWSINRIRITQFMEENQQHIEMESKTNSSTDIALGSRTGDNVAIGSVLEQYKSQSDLKKASSNGSVKRIVKLHNLMKKQTILTVIANGSTILCWIFVVVQPLTLYVTAYDFMLNAICMWLTMPSSNKYWLCCTKYGLCYCCYRKVSNIS